jgi:hypothetical protein
VEINLIIVISGKVLPAVIIKASSSRDMTGLPDMWRDLAFVLRRVLALPPLGPLRPLCPFLGVRLSVEISLIIVISGKVCLPVTSTLLQAPCPLSPVTCNLFLHLLYTIPAAFPVILVC